MANGIYVSHLVYDQVALKNVFVPNISRHELTDQFLFIDLVPPVEAKIFSNDHD